MRTFVAAFATLMLSVTTLPLQAQQEAEPEAVEVDEEIVIQGRRNLGPQVKKGFAAFEAGEFKKAESYFYRVRANYQLHASVTFERFADMWGVSALTGARGIHTGTGAAEVRKALAIIFYMEGMSQRAQGELASARRSFGRALEMNPKHFDARADLSLVEIERGKPAAADKHIERLARDFGKCEEPDDLASCTAIKERLLQVELAYGEAVSS